MIEEISLPNYQKQKPHIRGWYRDDSGTWNIRGKHCHIFLNERPQYCDRGTHLAVLELNNPTELTIDVADKWPRYFFGLDVAKQQCEIWLLRQDQIKPEDLAYSEVFPESAVVTGDRIHSTLIRTK